MFWPLYLGVLLTVASAANLPGVPTEFTADDDVLNAISADIAKRFEKEYVAFLKTGIESPALKQMSVQLAQSHSKKEIFRRELFELDSSDQFFICTTCRATVNVLARMFREEEGELNGPDAEELGKRIMLEICDRFEMQTEEVCSGLFDSHWPSAQYIIQNTTIDSSTFCTLFLQFGYCKAPFKNPDFNWTISVDTNRPANKEPTTKLPINETEQVHILHLTDIHYDPLYQPGALADCEEPLCCQRNKESAEGTSKAAGYWGDYRDCDAPWHMIEDALEFIKKTHPKIDYIYQTGDIVDHMVWATSIVKNTQVLTKFSNKLAELFPDVPVYHCIGNHEPHPLNLFSPNDVPTNVSTVWLYEHLHKEWSRWIPASTKETMLKGGYYTVSPKPGFRIIALNNNDCYTDNWWLFFNGTSGKPQLQWFHDTLHAAEKVGEHVHILLHIPTGDGTCWNVWAREYNRILHRFNNTVTGIFSGHSHKDDMYVHYAPTGEPFSVTWNGGSLTTFSFNNPNYRLYQAEPETMQVIDHETWIFNLTEANLHGAARSPQWKQEYVFSKEFTTDLTTAGIDALLHKMAQNPELVRRFWRYKMTSSDPHLSKGCDANCVVGIFCRLTSTVNNENNCEEMKTTLYAALARENGASSLLALSINSIVAMYLCVKYIL